MVCSFTGHRQIDERVRSILINLTARAVEYAYGEEVMGVGGGVCQASTTVYLAAIQSGMVQDKLNSAASQNVLSFMRLYSASDEVLLQAAADT